MKLKTDFVTNSSSCCFIISKGSIKSISTKIVKNIFKEWKINDYPAPKDFQNKIMKAIKNLKKDENVLIPFSCNYETCISKTSDESKIFVDTCTNHDWNNLPITSFCDENYDKEFEKELEHQETIEFINIDTGEKGSKKYLIDQNLKQLLSEGDQQ